MSGDLADIRERLARMETTQLHTNTVLNRLDTKFDGIDEWRGDVDRRLTVVETKAATVGSMAGTIAGGVMGIAVSLITAKLTGKA